MADHMLAVSIEADGNDVHAFLHWGDMWKHLTVPQKAQMISAIGDAMQDAADDVMAEARADIVAKVVDVMGITPEEALHRVEMAEQVLERLDDLDGWGDIDD